MLPLIVLPLITPTIIAPDAEHPKGAEKESFFRISRSGTWVPKRGGLKPAGKRQEAPHSCNAAFSMLQLQFFACCSAAFGQNDVRTAEKPMLQRSILKTAAQLPFSLVACCRGGV